MSILNENQRVLLAVLKVFLCVSNFPQLKQKTMFGLLIVLNVCQSYPINCYLCKKEVSLDHLFICLLGGVGSDDDDDDTSLHHP